MIHQGTGRHRRRWLPMRPATWPGRAMRHAPLWLIIAVASVQYYAEVRRDEPES